MKNCTYCKYAEWKLTANNRLHPSGDGQCTYPYKLPPLPASMYWVSQSKTPCGGFINRKEALKNDCTYYERG